MFDIMQNRRVLFGPGTVNEVGSILKDLNAVRLFVLVYNRQADILNDVLPKGDGTYICDIVQDEPDLAVIDQLVSLIKEHKSDAVLAIGGGSVMDAAKAAAMIATNGGIAEDYQIRGKAINCPSLPLIMVPTTSGTGSEATKVSVICNNESNLKKSIYSPHMIAGTVILDPAVTVGLPPGITASTGIDALSHAIESYVSLNRNVYTQMYGLKAVELIGKSLAAAVSDGTNMDARADMLYASYFAGCALNAGIGLAHMIAQPIGGLYKVPHGEACSIFLPHAMEYNLEYSAKEYCDIGRALGLDVSGDTREGALRTIEKVREVIAEVGTPTSLAPYMKNAETALSMDEMVETIQQATGHIKCNPRPVDGAAIKDVLGKTLKEMKI